MSEGSLVYIASARTTIETLSEKTKTTTTKFSSLIPLWHSGWEGPVDGVQGRFLIQKEMKQNLDSVPFYTRESIINR